MNQQIDAGLAAMGGGTVLERADRWPSPLDRIKLALAAVEEAIERGENQERIHITFINLVKITGSAYRSYRIAIGDPMFEPPNDAEMV